MPPAGYPAFLQYLQSGRVSELQGAVWRLQRRRGDHQRRHARCVLRDCPPATANLYADLNGDGAVTLDDVQVARQRIGASLFA
jgi:hypothetical protein